MVITMEYHNEAHETERAWIEVNLRNLQHNAAVLQEAMPQGCELMAVVKCRAYGHGDVLTAKELERAGVKAFAVAAIEEGIRLRENGIRGEILILGYTDVRRAADLARYELMQSIIDYEYAASLNEQGMRADVSVRTHVKIDTGMHRLGISAETFSEVKAVFGMKAIKVCGIYTHLCCADGRKPEDIAYTKEQIALFYRLLDALKKEGIQLPKQHIQSSYGLLNYPDLKCDYVRAGIALYGVLSSADDETVLKPDLRPVLSLKSRVALIRFVKKGSSVGYGRCFSVSRDSRIAILPVGYGDGYPGDLSCGRGSVLIRDHLVPVIGRVCMDQLIVDITDADDIMTGDAATLIGAEGYPELSAPYAAGKAGRISNELLCRMGARLPVVAVGLS
ncbi:MAG: serine racemase VanT catalytic subunit [Lachnospiraceae bacterium]|nr:serine racemase VanT catalytic subunit [Lachnospiraceae bacterium]